MPGSAINAFGFCLTSHLSPVLVGYITLMSGRGQKLSSLSIVLAVLLQNALHVT